MTSSLDPELLLREHAWLRRLALSLAADPAAADDLVQDTWVAALEHPPERSGESLRAWLAQVARNLVRGGGRRSANAHARERAVARGEALPSVSESVERVAAQRELVDAVLALAPLERDLVVLRYFEDQPPRVIAERLGLSGAAVRSRLSRTLTELRARLDRRFEGGRDAWAALLVPGGVREGRPAPAAPPLPLWLGAVGAGALVVVVTARALVPASEPEASARPAPVEGELAGAPPGPEMRAPEAPPVPASAPQRVALEATRSGSSAELATPAWTLAVRFVDENGAPLAGVRLEPSDRGDEWSGESDEAGNLRIDLPWPYTGHTVGRGELSVAAHGSALATRSWWVMPKGPGEQALGEIRMEPGGALVGRALDAEGRPLAGVLVTATQGYAPETESVRDEARTFGRSVRWLESGPSVPGRTGEDGRFEIEGVPATVVTVHATAPGFLGGFGAPVQVSAGSIVDAGEVVLARPGPENLLAGTVVDAAGAPVPGARIEYCEQDPRSSEGLQAYADAGGRFELLVPRGKSCTMLFSDSERGRDPLVLANVPAGTLELVVRLAAERWIELVALDEQQEIVPIRALSVWDENGLWLRATSEARPDGSQRLRVPSAPFMVCVVTPGWKNQPQGLLDPATVPDRLEFPLQRAAGIAGRVLADGVPVADAHVHAHAQGENGQYISDDGFHARVEPRPFAASETDAEGRFRIPSDSSRTVTLHVELEGWARAELGPLEFVDGVEQTGLELTLERGGTLEGRLLVAEGVDPSGKVIGVGCGEAHVVTQALGADGVYRFEHLRPGDYQVLTCDPEFLDRLQSGVYLWADPADPVVWSTSVRAGEVTHFDLDQRDWIPSRLTGELRFDGQPAVGWDCGLWNDGVGDSATLLAGRFDLRVPRPGPCSLYFRGSAGPAEVYLNQTLELAAGDNSWVRDLPTGTLTLENVPAFERTNPHYAEAPAFCLRWHDDPALTWTAELREPGTPGTAFTIPFVPAGRVRLLRRPEDEPLGVPDDAWPVVLELDLAAGAHATAAFP